MSQDQQEIVSIRIKNRSANCIVSFANGEFLLIHTDLVLKHSLTKGKILSEDELMTINYDSSLINAKRQGYSYASYALRTERQIMDKLTRLGYEDEIISLTIEFLTNFNLIDDYNYAIQFIKAKLKSKSISKNKLKMDLISKGIEKYTAEKAIENSYPTESTFDIALAAAQKKLRLIAHKPIEKQKNSLISFMAGQGFEWEIIRQVIEHLKID